MCSIQNLFERAADLVLIQQCTNTQCHIEPPSSSHELGQLFCSSQLLTWLNSNSSIKPIPNGTRMKWYIFPPQKSLFPQTPLSVIPVSLTTALTKNLTYPSKLGRHTLNAAVRFMTYPKLWNVVWEKRYGCGGKVHYAGEEKNSPEWPSDPRTSTKSQSLVHNIKSKYTINFQFQWYTIQIHRQCPSCTPKLLPTGNVSCYTDSTTDPEWYKLEFSPRNARTGTAN